LTKNSTSVKAITKTLAAPPMTALFDIKSSMSFKSLFDLDFLGRTGIWCAINKWPGADLTRHYNENKDLRNENSNHLFWWFGLRHVGL
jgi:hypothetical protein